MALLQRGIRFLSSSRHDLTWLTPFSAHEPLHLRHESLNLVPGSEEGEGALYAVAVFRLLGVSNDLPISNCRSGGGLLGFVVAKVVVSFTAKKKSQKNQRICLLKRGGLGRPVTGIGNVDT